MENNDRFTDIEIALTNQQRIIDDLNEVVINQGKEIERLKKEFKLLSDVVKTDNIKPLSEETPPPHY